MNDPKTTPAFPDTYECHHPQLGKTVGHQPGLSQYAYVAALFQAELVSHYAHYHASVAATAAFDYADAFFAELVKRTKS